MKMYLHKEAAIKYANEFLKAHVGLFQKAYTYFLWKIIIFKMCSQNMLWSIAVITMIIT